MWMAQFQVILIACLVAMTSALPGIFLVLRKMALMSDAISHSVLLGIILAFLAHKTFSFPFLFLGALTSGLGAVFFVEWLIQSKKIKKDAAIGVVFPCFFALAIILINQKSSHLHIDTDAVLLGELAFAPFRRLIIGGVDLGPTALWTMSLVFLGNISFIWLCYKELILSAFDPDFALTLRLCPRKMHYSLMLLTAITIITVFDCVGSILVVAFMITIPATAYLLVKRVFSMILCSLCIGSLTAVSGYFLAAAFNGSVAGAIATMAGAVFFLALLFSPRQGILFSRSSP